MDSFLIFGIEENVPVWYDDPTAYNPYRDYPIHDTAWVEDEEGFWFEIEPTVSALLAEGFIPTEEIPSEEQVEEWNSWPVCPADEDTTIGWVPLPRLAA